MRTYCRLWLIVCIHILCSTFSKEVIAVEISSKAIFAIKSGQWMDASIWNCSCVPGHKDNVLIDNNHWIELNQNAEVHHLTILHDGGLEFSWQSSVTLNIIGDLVCEGFIDPGIGRVYFSSRNNQTVRGYVDLFHLQTSGRKSLQIEGYVNVFHSIEIEKSKVISNDGLHLWPLNTVYRGVLLTQRGKLTGCVLVHGVLGIITKSDADKAPVQSYLANQRCKHSTEQNNLLSFKRNKENKSADDNNCYTSEKRPVQTFKLVDCRPLHERIFDKNPATGKVENNRFIRN